MTWSEWFWIGLGVVLIVLGLLDLFLSALDYDESGILTLRLQSLLWSTLRGVIRRLPAAWGKRVRAQVVGLQIILTLVVWVGLEIVGFGLVYYGLMYGHNFSFSGRNVRPSLDDALYYSAGQLSTAGGVGVIPQITFLRLLSVVEPLIGLAVVTLAITFLLSVFQTITSLRKLSSDLYLACPGTDDPLRILSLYFPEGRPTGLSELLGRLYADLGSYYSGLRLHHTAYYFQSRNAHISIPYAVDMLGGVIGALRWGLDEDNSASREPMNALLANQLSEFLYALDGQLQRQAGEVPRPAPYQEFTRAYNDGENTGDTWLNRFLRVDRSMHQMVRSQHAPDAHAAYRRYAEWLPFAYRTRQVVESTARHLGYDPDTMAYRSLD